MRRSYRSARFLAILDEVRAAIPDAAISTDIIVGFPGETDDDFAATLDVVEKARFASAFTFQYSPRPGHARRPTLPDQVPKAVVQERYERLVALQEEISWAQNRTLEGRTVEVLVATGEGRKDAATRRMSGRARDGRLVHFAPGDAGGAARRRRDGRGDLRRAAPSRRRRSAAGPPAHPGGRRARGGQRRRGRAGSRRRGWACRASARRRRCRPSGCAVGRGGAG